MPWARNGVRLKAACYIGGFHPHYRTQHVCLFGSNQATNLNRTTATDITRVSIRNILTTTHPGYMGHDTYTQTPTHTHANPHICPCASTNSGLTAMHLAVSHEHHGRPAHSLLRWIPEVFFVFDVMGCFIDQQERSRLKPNISPWLCISRRNDRTHMHEGTF